VRYVEDGAPSAAALPYTVRTYLSRWGRRVPGHPKLLVCGAAYDTVNVSGEMRAWPFVFSDDYVGGTDVGWVRTLDFEAALGKSNASDGTLLAAMAISGAAVSPGLGQIDLGTLNIVLSFLNARLGVWLPNPPYINELRDDREFPSREGPALRWLRTRRATYLFKELFGVHDREDRFLYVTDGGQLDNLGLLELLSRRCRLIVSFDASGDELLSTNTFDGVRQLAWDRYRVRFSEPGGEPDPPCGDPATYDGPPLKVTNKRVTPGLTGPGQEKYGLVNRIAEAAVAHLEIHYMDGTKGDLVFSKAVLSPETPDEVLVFAATTKKFPRDSTADQFLEPEQVTQYVSLGRAVGRRAGEIARRILDGEPDATDRVPQSGRGFDHQPIWAGSSPAGATDPAQMAGS
jgi:hypothetical protein